MKKGVVFLLLLASYIQGACAGRDTIKRAGLKDQTDLLDVKASLFHKETKLDTSILKLQKLFIPSFTYNPSAGFELGLTLAALKFLGHPDSTSLSSGEIEVSASTKGLAYINYKHSIYLPENKWSLQGNWQVGRTLATDYGVGTGQYSENEDGNLPSNSYLPGSPPNVYKLKYTSVRFRETAYKKITGHFYTGIGLNINAYTGIDEESRDDLTTHNYRYSDLNGFLPWRYLANSLSFNLQYDDRDHPNQPYKGMYGNVGIKTSKKILGSSANSTQLMTEYRKYWSLSAVNPQHVLAFWHWGSYLLSGKIPYLELPGTSGDNDGRSGRAYTVGRFKGYSFFYSEAEYRFPILANKLISGVAFINAQTGSNPNAQKPIKLFQYWEPGTGAGLRILYNKYSRSNICIDYGVGRYGTRGVFINLNEAF
ncbi:BamA/TamA family outer membrane protein [Mucilaginibacter mali]|uniref:BamA/TamA family outer membrane protein n=1 Tax=Mucilaginibacter mali TaxID=2740462 RepID=A0A7D4QJE2_9SPHI|nr:BamA/TamA family outer membrane protein [Mucilaginibacter mali]QKJ29730.1 BamA/TamA family outer membrane protein [Mucilaginibacter mali]